MPPEVRHAGLILLLVYPAGLAAQTEVSKEIRPYSSDATSRESDPVWVTTSRPVAASARLSPSERLDRARSQPEAFASSQPEAFPSGTLAPSAADDSAEDGVVPGLNAMPAEASGVTSSAAASPGTKNLAKMSPSPFPAMPPPGTKTSAPVGRSSGQFGDIGPLVTAGGSLALVLGLFMIMAWIMRRTVPGAVQALPGEVVEVLGRAPLAGRQQVHLIRCGNKLILVSVTPEGAETLTEITDPEEVDRLAGLCRGTHPGSATSAFRHVFGQLSRQRTDSEMVVDSGDLDLSGIGIVQSAPGGTGGQR